MKPSDIPGTFGKRETFEAMLRLEHEREVIKIQQEHEKELAKLELKTVHAAQPPPISVSITIASADMARASFYVLVIVALVLIYRRAESVYRQGRYL